VFRKLAMRKFGLSLAVIMPFVLAACGEGQAGAPILFEWEDYTAAPFYAEYLKTHGVRPETAVFADEDEALAKMRAGYAPDVMGPCYYEYKRWQEAGLLQPIDTTKLANWNKIAPALRDLPGISAGEGKVWFVPHYWGDTSITFRTDLAPEYVDKETWEILFDPKYKGKIAVLEGVDDTVPFIARMIGIDAYAMNDADWQKVQAKLRELVPQLRFVSSDNTSLAQGLASGEIVAAMSWRTVYTNLVAQGVKVAHMNPPGGIFTYVCGLTIHKNAKDYDKALALIDSVISGDASRYALAEIGDIPANTSAIESVPDETFKKLGLPRDLDAYLAKNTFQQPLKDKEKIVNAWTEIRAGL
jgi:spermidine/putrescine transport system substrate-binding protein